MHQERRRRRSDSPAEASRLYLTALAARLRARSIVIADEDGLLVAGIGNDDLEAVAALGAEGVPGARVHDLSMDCGGWRLRLLAVDGEAPPILPTSAALTRILAAA